VLEARIAHTRKYPEVDEIYSLQVFDNFIYAATSNRACYRRYCCGCVCHILGISKAIDWILETRICQEYDDNS
jgi:hypothetical protein